VSKMCTSASWCLLFLATVALCDAVLVGSITQPSVGSPWPLPASMNTSTNFQPIDAMLFRFSVTKHSCDTLEVAFLRYFDIIFHGQPFHKRSSGVDMGKMEERDSQQLLFKPKTSDGGLTSLDVALLNECEKWPSLEMDESCECRFTLNRLTIIYIR